MTKKSVLPIFETFLQKSFVKDQKYFRGTCCFSISENLLTIHLTYAENGLVKTDVFFGTPLTCAYAGGVKADWAAKPDQSALITGKYRVLRIGFSGQGQTFFENEVEPDIVDFPN